MCAAKFWSFHRQMILPMPGIRLSHQSVGTQFVPSRRLMRGNVSKRCVPSLRFWLPEIAVFEALFEIWMRHAALHAMHWEGNSMAGWYDDGSEEEAQAHRRARAAELAKKKTKPAVAQVDAGEICETNMASEYPSGIEPPAGMVCGEVYQLLGAIVFDYPQMVPNAEKWLDNLSQARLVHDDLLPAIIAAPPEPAVAQTELPETQQEWLDFYRGQVASLTQRLQASEAREAELKAEIAALNSDIEDWQNGGRMDEEEFQDICGEASVRPSPCCAPKICHLAPFHEIRELRAELKTVLDRESASAKRHDDRMEALERSHKALLNHAKRWQTYLRQVHLPDSGVDADIAAAEKL